MSRLLDRILTEPVTVAPSIAKALNDEERAAIGNVRVVADDVTRMYWQSLQIDWDFRSDFGPLRPPFDLMWIEGRIPLKLYSDGRWHTTPSRQQVTNGSFVWVEPADGTAPDSITPDVGAFDGGLVVCMTHFMSFRDGVVVRMPCGSRIHISEDGKYLDRIVTTPPEWGQTPDLDVDGRAMHVRSEAMSAHQTMLAISLMNCKNVTLVDETPPSKVSAKHQARTGVPLTRYTRIVLPSASHAATTKKEAQDAAGAVQPWHLVRGHFKTYTEDAPLFGSKTGTWWWGWQARGSKKAGVHLPTYDVSPSR